MLGCVLPFAAAVLRPEEPSTHRRVAAPLLHGQPLRITHNETVSRLQVGASLTRLLANLSYSASTPQEGQGQADGSNATAEEVAEEIWKGYSESNEDAYPAGEELAIATSNQTDDADHNETTDADGAVMRTAGITWALPEAAVSEANMVLANNSVGDDDALPGP